MSSIILHMDMDAFFAAIEQLDFPELRGKPVVVGADPKGGEGRGVVSTCSYEARTYGIHSAMPISRAWKQCPHAVFVKPRGKRYAEVSRRVMQILQRYSPDLEPLSIDEAFLDITSTYKLHKTPRQLGEHLKQCIQNEVHLTASVGIAPNKFLAKIASDLDKPDGMVVVQADEVECFLHPLDISRLWGVGRKTLPLLKDMGIHTIGDLMQYSLDFLQSRFGKMGVKLYNLARGIDDRLVCTDEERKSISREITYDQDVDDAETHRRTLLYLCNELSRDMRRKKIWGRTISIKVRQQNFSTFTRSRTLEQSMQHFDDLYPHALDLFVRLNLSGKLRLLGVGVSKLESSPGQLDMFADQTQNTSKLDDVLDTVREKFGETSITRASLIDDKHPEKWIRD
ncbi:MAG: DNA polymerase IV [candidate division KSB1 bacterium]|nr:DNA polymerase IV [candidate division KSB1 bacterium]